MSNTRTKKTGAGEKSATAEEKKTVRRGKGAKSESKAGVKTGTKTGTKTGAKTAAKPRAARARGRAETSQGKDPEVVSVIARLASKLLSHGKAGDLNEATRLAGTLIEQGVDLERVFGELEKLDEARLTQSEKENSDALAAALEVVTMQSSEDSEDAGEIESGSRDVKKDSDKEPGETVRYPLIVMSDAVINPAAHMQMSITRESSVNALKYAAVDGDGMVVLFTRADDGDDAASSDNLFKVGTLIKILSLKENSRGLIVTVRGVSRVSPVKLDELNEHLFRMAEVRVLEDEKVDDVTAERYIESLRSAFDSAFDQQKNNKGRAVIDGSVPNENIKAVRELKDLGRMADAFAQLLLMQNVDKRYVLEHLNPVDRALAVIAFLNNYNYKSEVDKKIYDDAREAMERNQREYYLHEQLRSIKRMLNIAADDGSDIEEFKSRLSALDAPAEVISRIQKEISRLSLMSSNSSENGMVRNYIDVLLSLPWRKSSDLNCDLRKAGEMLDAEHYGLKKVKERILEFLAVQTRRAGKNEPSGQILCLMGPPGIGKTSLGASIAKATGRKYVRVALGGMYDESEIRGHRRTYLGAMPGRIIQSLAKVGVNNPLFLLDEIDKVSSSNFHGDIAAALLEVLDPEQNKTFSDNYVDLDFDLSKVLFIATANSYNIPAALRDRMEIIDLSSYTVDEKFHIARKHLLPKQLKANALEESEFDISDAGIKQLINHYTYEAGVRNLERIIAELCRKTVVDIMMHPKKKAKRSAIGVRDIEKMLGPKRHDFTSKLSENKVGIVNGLSVSSAGGDMLQVEVIANEGKGSHTLTGQLGSVMKESVTAAISWVRSDARKLSLAPDFYQNVDLHVHFPEGAIPKDGPSAGITTVTAIVSALTGNPVRADVAMTGEITLRGDVLTIGGLKEKLLAALRGGVKTVCIPFDNKKDLWDIPKNVTDGLKIVPVKTINEVLDIALENRPDGFIPVTNELWTLKSYSEREQKRRLREAVDEHKFTTEINDLDDPAIIAIRNGEESKR